MRWLALGHTANYCSAEIITQFKVSESQDYMFSAGKYSSYMQYKGILAILSFFHYFSKPTRNKKAFLHSCLCLLLVTFTLVRLWELTGFIQFTNFLLTSTSFRVVYLIIFCTGASSDDLGPLTESHLHSNQGIRTAWNQRGNKGQIVGGPGISKQVINFLPGVTDWLWK